MARLEDLACMGDAFEPNEPTSLTDICTCPECDATFAFSDLGYDDDAFWCDDCEDAHAGFICPNCSALFGVAGHPARNPIHVGKEKA